MRDFISSPITALVEMDSKWYPSPRHPLRNSAVKSNPILSKRVASLDIGTNTILLLIAEVEGKRLIPLLDTETIVRLGEGLQKTQLLSEEAMQRGLQTLAQYLSQCQRMGVEKIFAIGTNPLREAKNSKNFLEMVKERVDLSIEVISEEEEAQLSFLSVAKDLKEIDHSIYVIDVGGGSTEFILGKGGQMDQWVSLPLGSVRFTEQFLHSDPINEREWDEMEKKIEDLLAEIPLPKNPFTLVAVGGTATTLASVELGLKEFKSEKIHHFELSRDALERQLSLYRSKTTLKRGEIPGLPAARADVIPAGGAILYKAMEYIGCDSVTINCHGVRYGLLYKMLHL